MPRARVTKTWRELFAIVEAGNDVPYERRVQVKYEAAHALAASPRAVFEVLEMNGGRAAMVQDGAECRHSPTGTSRGQPGRAMCV
jgi:hypothetical protein